MPDLTDKLELQLARLRRRAIAPDPYPPRLRFDREQRAQLLTTLEYLLDNPSKLQVHGESARSATSSVASSS